MGTLRGLRAFALVACAAAAVAPHATPSPARAAETSPANVAAARRHYEKARSLYQQGAYHEAINELEAAHALDPNAKDLVFNLGVVHEKLADIDEALTWFRLYATMDLTDPERERCDAYIRRLEGAKKEIEDKQRAAAASASAPATSAPLPPPPPPPPPPGNGRIDAATIGAGTFAALALGFGVFMGLKAKSDQPPSGLVTGPNGSYGDLASRADSAHREAVMADVGFGVAAVAGIAAAYLYFGRPKTGPSAAPPAIGSASLSALPVAGGGGALVVRGSFQ